MQEEDQILSAPRIRGRVNISISHNLNWNHYNLDRQKNFTLFQEEKCDMESEDGQTDRQKIDRQTDKTYIRRNRQTQLDRRIKADRQTA